MKSALIPLPDFRRPAIQVARRLQACHTDALSFPLAPRCPTLGSVARRRRLPAICAREPRMTLVVITQQQPEPQRAIVQDDTQERELRTAKQAIRDKDRELEALRGEIAEMKRLEFIRKAAKGSPGHSRHNQTNGPATIATLPDTPIVRGEVVGGIRTVVRGNV